VRTWNFTDGCGNTSANFVQTITVIDTIAPVWTTIARSLNTTIECSDTQALANAQNLFPVASDNCDADVSNIVKVTGTFVASTTCANAGTYTNTWTVTDDCGNTSETFTQIITTQDTTAPTFIAPSDITLSSGTNCNADISTTITGDVTGIQDNCDPNPTTSFIDSDCFGNFNSASVNSGTGNYFPFTVSGFDNESANAIKKVALAFETNQGKGRAEFVLVAPNGQGIVLVAPYCNGGDCDNPTPNEKELYLPEFYPNSSNYPKWDNNNPIATNSVQNFTPNGALSTINTVSGLNTLVSSFEEFTGNLNGNWFLFARKNETENGKIEFKSVCLTPGSNLCGNNKVIIRKWSVSDACSNTVSFNQIIKIVDTTKPTWTTETGSLNTTIECSDTQALANAQNLFPIATDNCDADVSNIIKVAGTFVASETCANAGTYTNTWTVTDDCGNTSETFTQVLTLQDKMAPKIITEASDRTIECDGECDNNEIVNWLANNGGAIASDNCSEVTWTNNFDTIVYNCYTSITVTFTATDACGNTASTSAKFTAQDTTPPLVPEVLTDITVECTSNLPVILTPTSNNNGFNNVTTEEVNSIELGKCENSYTLYRTLNFKDACDNISSVSQTVHVVDNTPPTIASLPETKTITCPDVPVFEQAIATDGCSNSSLTFNDVKTEGNCPGFYSITRTWRAIDSCGNSTTASQTINVEDRTGPVTTTEFNSTINVNCDAIPARPELVFVDGCSTINPAVFTETISNQTTDSYVINRKWIATDTCGNSSEFVQTVNVTITNSLIALTGSVCNDGETTSIDLTSLFPSGTPTTGTWTDVSNTGKLEGNNFNAATLAVGNYIFEYTINDPNCPRSIRITITVTTGCGGIVLPCGTIVVHNAFSPNGDGINEKFVIDNINDTNCYPNNTVEIYNRWGVLVYSTNGYNNTTNAFDGISIGQSAVSQSSGLPAGTYFYILTYTSFDNNNTIQNNKKVGYLFLTK
jgi:gliding motility-associated-like protein